ncbi:hypothetical protein Glove_42g69 [Diversispora epigaea]|uniref:Uncharacterized protein n=1 Tax=Diversispora epigaea TaxID=1348612 RepID=A0A397JFX2_9GLOM|nr:hypothetical protein Glove_42g69 [Diversispora epigaea]
MPKFGPVQCSHSRPATTPPTSQQLQFQKSNEEKFHRFQEKEPTLTAEPATYAYPRAVVQFIRPRFPINVKPVIPIPGE